MWSISPASLRYDRLTPVAQLAGPRCLASDPLLDCGVLTVVVGVAGGRVWVEHLREKEIFRVQRHLLYASHAAAVTHWGQQKAAAAGKGPPRPKRSLTPNRTLTRRLSRPQGSRARTQA